MSGDIHISPGEARLSDDELCLFLRVLFSLPVRGERFPAGPGNRSASSPDPSASSSVSTLSVESEILTAAPGFRESPSDGTGRVFSNNTAGTSDVRKFVSGVKSPPPFSGSPSVGSHSAIIADCGFILSLSRETRTPLKNPASYPRVRL